LEKDLKTANQELSESDFLILKLRQDQSDLQAQITVLETSLEKAQAELEREKAQLSAYDEELKELEALSKQQSKTVAESQLELQNLTHETERLSKEYHSLSNAMKDLEDAHDWIEDQRQYARVTQSHTVAIGTSRHSLTDYFCYFFCLVYLAKPVDPMTSVLKIHPRVARS